MAFEQPELGLANVRGQGAVPGEPVEQRRRVIRRQSFPDVHTLVHHRLGAEAGEKQPPVLRRKDAEQVRDGATAIDAVGFFAAFDDHQNSPCSAGFGGAVAGRAALEECRAAEPVSESAPGGLEVAAEGVKIEVHQAIRKRATRKVGCVRAYDVSQRTGGQRGLTEAGGPDNSGIQAGAQPLNKLVPFRFAAEELGGSRRHLARNAGRLISGGGTGDQLDDYFGGRGGRGGRRAWSWRRDGRWRRKHIVAKEVARGAANLIATLARFGDGEMVFVETNRICAHARVSGSGVDDGEQSFNATLLEVGDCLNLVVRGVIAIPVEQIAQVGIVLAKVLDADRRAKDGAKGIHQRCQRGPCVRRCEEQDGDCPTGHALLVRLRGVAGFSKDLLGEQATEAMANEHQGTIAEAVLDHQVQHLQGSVGQRHAVTGIARAQSDQSRNPGPAGRTGSVAERPDADLWELAPQPMRPRGGIVLSVAPGGERIAAEAMQEDDIRLAGGFVTARDLMKLAHGSTFYYVRSDRGSVTLFSLVRLKRVSANCATNPDRSATALTWLARAVFARSGSRPMR